MVDVGDLHAAHQPPELLLCQQFLCLCRCAGPLKTIIPVEYLVEEKPAVAFPTDPPDPSGAAAAEEEQSMLVIRLHLELTLHQVDQPLQTMAEIRLAGPMQTVNCFDSLQVAVTDLFQCP